MAQQGIQIPDIPRVAVPDQAPSDRISTDVVDRSAGDANITNQVEKTGEETEKILGAYERMKAHTTATDAGNQFEQDFRTRLNGAPAAADGSSPAILGAIHDQGDPTDIYNNFDSKTNSAMKAIQDKYADSSNATKVAVNKELAQRFNNLQDIRITAYGAQQFKYEKSVQDNNDTLLQKGMADSVANLSHYDPNGPNDPTASKDTASFDSFVQQSKDSWLKYGLKTGAAVIDPNGNQAFVGDDGNLVRVNASPAIQTSIASSVSGGTSTAINNLINAGQLDNAKYMMDNYKQQVDSDTYSKLDQLYIKADIKQQAMNLVANTDGKPIDQQQKLFNQVSGPNAEQIKIEAEQNQDSLDRFREDRIRRSSTDAFNQALSLVANKQQSASPFLDTTSMKNNPIVSKIIPRITDGKQLEALYSSVKPPETSNPSQLNDFWNLSTQPGALAALSYGDYTQMVSKLNKADKAQTFSSWKAANDQTQAQQFQMSTRATQLVDENAQMLGLVKKVNGQYSDKDLATLNSLKAAVQAQVTGNYKWMSPGDLEKQTYAIVAAKRAEQIQQRSQQGGVLHDVYNKARNLLGLPPIAAPTPAPLMQVQPFTRQSSGPAPDVTSQGIAPSPGETPKPAAPAALPTKGPTAAAPQASSVKLPTATAAPVSAMSPGDRIQATIRFNKANGRMPQPGSSELDNFVKTEKKSK